MSGIAGSSQPFQCAVPFAGQTNQISSSLSPNRDCSLKRVKPVFPLNRNGYYTAFSMPVPGRWTSLASVFLLNGALLNRSPPPCIGTFDTRSNTTSHLRVGVPEQDSPPADSLAGDTDNRDGDTDSLSSRDSRHVPKPCDSGRLRSSHGYKINTKNRKTIA